MISFDGNRSEVNAADRSVALGPLEFAMLRLVANASNGISPQAICERLYLADPQGGPELGPRVVHQRRCHINRKIKALGIAIMPHKKGAGCVYELKAIAMTELRRAIMDELDAHPG